MELVPDAIRTVRITPTFDAWRRAARRLLQAGVRPETVTWVEDGGMAASLFDEDMGAAAAPAPASAAAVAVPRRFLALAERVAAHGAADRWSVLYRLLWRLTHDEHDLLARADDPDVARALALAQGGATAPGSVGLPDASAFLPANPTLSTLREAALGCTACPLHEPASRTVFGAGPLEARVMFVGEQPGDQEDLQGLPFVGPAGEVLTRGLAEVGLPRDDVYITNVVKHFKFVPRGKRRIHQTPQAPEIAACRPWLEAEITQVKPALIVCLGSTAAQALMGPDFRILRNRGRMFQTRWAPWLMATVHPSSILRVDDPAAQERAYHDFVSDLRVAAEKLKTLAAAPPALA